MNRLTKLTIFLSTILFFGCENVLNNESVPLTEMNVFVLCEGNFSESNSSLWMLNPEKPEVSGPIYQNQTGQPLGDIGQSITVDGDRLFVVNNNSHSIEEFSMNGDQITHIKKIDLAGASPRHMAVHNGKAYITAWNVNGIIVMNLNIYSIEDTIPVNGLPEMIIFYEDYFYTSITMKPDWTADNRILKIYTDGTLSKTYEVVKGPGNMVIQDNKLYVASTYFGEDWSTNAGNSVIDLSNDKVKKNDLGHTNDYGADLVPINNIIYRSFKGGIAALKPDLTADASNTIGTITKTYAAAAFGKYIFLTQTDYQAPDTVYVYDRSGAEIQKYAVGAIPGSFAIFDKKVN